MCELPQPDLLCDGPLPCMPWLLVLPREGESGVFRRESPSLSTWAEPAEGPLPPCADFTAVVWLALEAPLPDVADLGFCSVPNCALAPELVGALDWGLLPPAGCICNHETHTRQFTESVLLGQPSADARAAVSFKAGVCSGLRPAATCTEAVSKCSLHQT